MKATAGSWCIQHNPTPLPYFSNFSRQIDLDFQHESAPLIRFSYSRVLELYKKGRLETTCGAKHALYGSKEGYVSPWDDKPYEILPSGKKAYLDEQDVVTFLDPPKELIPLDPASYNPAAYLWKKIEDIPEERRYRLLDLIEPRVISRAWQIAGTRYEDSKLVKKSASTLLSNEDDVMLEHYSCRSSGGPMPISWMKVFKKALFSCKGGNIYGRLIGKIFNFDRNSYVQVFDPHYTEGGSVLAAVANSFTPLYFMVRQVNEVMSTEQPCDLAYEFGDGLFHIQELPQDFPRPMKHGYPFDDQVAIYVRYLGPGVLVGQAWQEGKKLEQVPRKLCGDILMERGNEALGYIDVMLLERIAHMIDKTAKVEFAKSEYNSADDSTTFYVYNKSLSISGP